MTERRWEVSIALGLLAGIFVFTVLASAPPAPKDADAPIDEFSAARALVELERLLGDQTPHPVGSAANDRVRERLVRRLEEIGLRSEIQETIGCSARWSGCGRVRNVVTRIRGERESGILLMAHYDSVPSAPGAGDDGAAVAALLEIARILAAGGSHRNSVLFVFTDGEEAPLLGAEAFFAEHPWARSALAVINVEGAGSDGPAFLLRIGPRSGALVRAFREVAPHPAAQSVAQEVFKYMPNDTDFSVAMRAGKPGIDFAFAGERNHYHTPLDSIEMLNPGTMQHHGENLLPLVRTLLAADLEATEPNFVFMTLAPGWWLAWSPQAGVGLACLGLALLGVVTWRARRELTPGKLVGGVGLALLVLLGVTVAELSLLWLADQLAGTRVAWPANPWPWRLVIYATPVGVLASLGPVARRLGRWAALLGAWWLWSALALALALAAPLAAHLLLPASLGASALLVAATFARPHAALAAIATVVAALLAGTLWFPLVYNGESVQGLALAPVMFVPLAVVATTLTPLLATPSPGTEVRILRIGAAVVAAAGLAWSAFVPLYSEMRPQHLNFGYVQDADAGTAHYVAWSPNPLPARVLETQPFERSGTPLPPWASAPLPAAPAPSTPALAPELVALDDGDGDPRTRLLQVRSRRNARTLALRIPAAAGLQAIEVNGRPTGHGSPGDEAYVTLSLVSLPPEGFEVALRFAHADPVEAYLADATSDLPESAHPLVEARGSLAVPVHEGDEWVVYRRVTLR